MPLMVDSSDACLSGISEHRHELVFICFCFLSSTKQTPYSNKIINLMIMVTQKKKSIYQ